MKNFLGMILAFLLISVLVVPVFIWGLFVYKKDNYFFKIAMGLDQLGGSILFNKINWTVSVYTGYLVYIKKDKKWEWFAKLINFLFQDSKHCKKAYYWDLNYNAKYELEKEV